MGLVGTVPFVVMADPDQVVTELSEVNNRRTVTAIVRPPGTLPDPSDNLAPVITSVPPTTAILGQLYTYQVVAVDPEGGPLEFGMNDDDRTPTSMVIDPLSGLLTWTPTGRLGRRNPNLFVRDIVGNITIQNLQLEVLDPADKRPPLFESRPLSIARPGALYRYNVVVRDPDGGPVSTVLAAAPSGAQYDPGTQSVTWTPTAANLGSHVFRLSAVDDEITSTDQTWIVTVSQSSSSGIDLTIVAIDDKDVVAHAQTRLATGMAHVQVANQGRGDAATFKIGVFDDTNHSGQFEREIDTQLGLASQSEGVLPPARCAQM